MRRLMLAAVALIYAAYALGILPLLVLSVMFIAWIASFCLLEATSRYEGTPLKWPAYACCVTSLGMILCVWWAL
jgi:hypothetical protein